MARPIVLSNGALHVGINNFGLVHDLYFPYVGLENHAAGKESRHHVGVWVDGTISWLDLNADEWLMDFSYVQKSLIGRVRASNEKLGVVLEFNDAVDTDIDVFMRNIQVINTHGYEREIRLFMHQAFVIGDSRSNTDTAQYLPDSNAILHYRGRRVFVVSGSQHDKPFDQHTVGLFGIEGREGTFRDAEDGVLSTGNVEHGRVDSTIGFTLNIDAHDSARVHYWIAAGESLREALHVNKTVQRIGVDRLMHSTLDWWRTWLTPALNVAEKLDDKYQEEFIKSILIIKSQIDKRGAIMASTDSAMLNYWRDAYAYCWPRDGAYVMWPLIRLGYTEEPLNFFEFCKNVMHPAGYLMHKFRADGALGSSWHTYIHEDNVVAPPIQTDETALTLFVFAQYYNMHPDKKLLADYYQDMIEPMASFLAEFIDSKTGLPKPSYDLWEEVFMTTTYTTSVTYAALLAAADLADAADDANNAVAWRTAADGLYESAHKHLYNKNRKSFYKGILATKSGLTKSEVIDSSSVFGSFMFGLFPVREKELQTALQSFLAAFPVQNGAYGLPRYENDNYLRTNDNVMGNWWFICSLWLAQYCLETDDQTMARNIVDWVLTYALPTGILAEQVDPTTGQMVSVAPLTWTHAELVSTMLDMITDTGDT